MESTIACSKVSDKTFRGDTVQISMIAYQKSNGLQRYLVGGAVRDQAAQY